MMFEMNDPYEWSHIEISFEVASRVSSRASNLLKKNVGYVSYMQKILKVYNTTLLLGDWVTMHGSRVGGNIVERSSDREIHE